LEVVRVKLGDLLSSATLAIIEKTGCDETSASEAAAEVMIRLAARGAIDSMWLDDVRRLSTAIDAGERT